MLRRNAPWPPRGSASPWLRGVVACLLVGSLALVGCREKRDGFEARLAQAVQSSARAGGVLRMEDATDFTWDELHVFGPYVSAEQMHQQLGFAWAGASHQDSDSQTLLVFTRGQQVVRQLDFPRGQGDFADLSLMRFTRQDARFHVKPQGGFITVSRVPLDAEAPTGSDAGRP